MCLAVCGRVCRWSSVCVCTCVCVGVSVDEARCLGTRFSCDVKSRGLGLEQRLTASLNSVEAPCPAYHISLSRTCTRTHKDTDLSHTHTHTKTLTLTCTHTHTHTIRTYTLEPDRYIGRPILGIFRSIGIGIYTGYLYFFVQRNLSFIS